MPATESATGVGQQAGTAQVVSQEVEQPIRALPRTANNTGGNGLPRQTVQTPFHRHIRHPGAGASGKTNARIPGLLLLFFVVGERVIGDGSAIARSGSHGFDPLAAGIVGKGGTATPTHDAHQPVFCIIQLAVGGTAFNAAGHVAVSIINIGLGAFAVAMGSGMFVCRRRCTLTSSVVITGMYPQLYR